MCVVAKNDDSWCLSRGEALYKPPPPLTVYKTSPCVRNACVYLQLCKQALASIDLSLTAARTKHTVALSPTAARAKHTPGTNFCH